MEQIIINKGDSFSHTVTAISVADLSTYTLKMYIVDSDGEAVATITGSKAALVMTFAADNEATKAYAAGTHHYEVKIFDASDHVYTEEKGHFVVNTPVRSDPS